MSATTLFGALLPDIQKRRVKLAIIKEPFRDLRPTWAERTDWFKAQRRRECQKVQPALEFKA